MHTTRGGARRLNSTWHAKHPSIPILRIFRALTPCVEHAPTGLLQHTFPIFFVSCSLMPGASHERGGAVKFSQHEHWRVSYILSFVTSMLQNTFVTYFTIIIRRIMAFRRIMTYASIIVISSTKRILSCLKHGHAPIT
jgi:hypothetical protein